MDTLEVIAPKELPNAYLKTFDEYKDLYLKSVQDPITFWKEQAEEFLTWDSPFESVLNGELTKGNVKYFEGGKLNVCYNCVDRHLPKKADQIALIYEGDDPKDTKNVTYSELKDKVCQTANLLKELKIKRGDKIAIYMPTCLEAVYAMLACARIGAIHSVVFGGFSANALKERILDSECKIVFTTDQGMRKGRPVNLKEIVDEAVKELKCVEHVIIHKNTGGKIDIQEPRDIWFEEGIERQETECEIEKMDSESELFLLYTSGSTGKPKGIAHTTAGYLLYTAITFRYIFNYHEGDVHACVADIGWITGHSYVVYGPLCVGATSMLFDGVPIHPDASRYWEVIEKHKVTTFYTSPTAIRLLMQFSDDYVLKHDLSSLRIIGSVGEPINPEAWRWYYKVVGQEKCTVVDTYWQTETGGVILTPIPSVTPLKPGATSLPFFGIQPVVLDPNSGDVIDTMVADGVLAIKSSWPGIARSIYGDHDRYLMTYFSPYPGFYFTGDSVHRDQHGYFWINGRVDDVINVSGHRLGTMEIESALVSHPACVEAAVVGTPHDIKGQSIFAYCTINPQYKHLDPKELEAMLKNQVAQQISKIAIPDTIVFTNTLPKTRSGKIMRRILRKISTDSNPRQSLGDISTLSDPAVVDTLINKVQELLGLPKRCDLQ